MKVTLDLDPRRVWRLEELAEVQGQSLSEVVNGLLALSGPRHKGRVSASRSEETRRLVRELHAVGLTDAQIGLRIDRVSAHVGRVRRELGLKANKGKGGRVTAGGGWPGFRPEKIEALARMLDSDERETVNVWMIWGRRDGEYWLVDAWAADSRAANPRGWARKLAEARSQCGDSNVAVCVTWVDFGGVVAAFEAARVSNSGLTGPGEQANNKEEK